MARGCDSGSSVADTFAHAFDDKLHREGQQLGLGLEVVPQRPHRPACLGGHAPQGGSLDPVAHHESPERVGELLPALGVVYLFRHLELF